ncbi:hypothetical protein ED733_000166 [Metarhizium rileyi]|uniref:Uncharacterized protein n=1 Tax=Metarhizium rileyi (strain RCEF 4871) TaxID=1649241 RepID=A0A5C6GET4_METRR|nr:hypothetical protein ED733_000166 [Metarhizium rileyi]
MFIRASKSPTRRPQSTQALRARPASDFPPKSPQQQVLIGEAGVDVAEKKFPIEAPSNEAFNGETQLKLDNTSLPHLNINSIRAPKDHHKTGQIGKLDLQTSFCFYFDPSTQCYESVLDWAPAEKRVSLRRKRRKRRKKKARR